MSKEDLIPFVPGKSGNPNGRPRGVPNTKTRLRRLLEITQDLKSPITGEVEGFTVAEQMDLAMIMRAKEGDVSAYKTIVDRLEGTPQQSIDHTTLGKELPMPILGGASVIRTDDSSTEASSS